jgi:hypothetical protein
MCLKGLEVVKTRIRFLFNFLVVRVDMSFPGPVSHGIWKIEHFHEVRHVCNVGVRVRKLYTEAAAVYYNGVFLCYERIACAETLNI